MKTVTRTTRSNEIYDLEIPQLDAGRERSSQSEDVTLELADLSAGQLSAVAALMFALDAAEIRARAVERKLARHATLCICQVAEATAEVPCVTETFRAAA